MNIYSLIPIIAFLFNGFVWTYIFAQKKQSTINRAFLFYGGVLAYWIFIVFLLRQPVPPNIVLPLMKSASVSWLSISFLFLNFTYVFIQKKRDTIYYILLVAVVISIVISLTTNEVLSGFEYVNWGVNKIVGPLFLPFISIVVAIPAYYSLYLIYRALKVTKDYNLRHSLPLLFIGSLFTLLIGLASNVVIPLFLGLNHFVEFAESGTVIQSIFIFRAVVKYKLFGIGVDELGHELFANMQDAVIIISKDGIIQQANEAAEFFFKHEENELLGKPIVYLIQDYKINKFYQNYDLECKIENEKKWISLSSSVIREDDVELGQIIMIRDITFRKMNEEIISKGKALLQQAEQLAHLGSWEWDLVSGEITWSDELYNIYEVTRKDFDNTIESFLSFVHPDEIESVREDIKNAIDNKTSYQHYKRIIVPSGKIKYLYSSGIVQTDRNKKPVRFIGASLDVTEFKKIESELRDSQEKLRALSSNLQDARETERAHISREIHDELGQVLTAVKMDISLLSESIEIAENITDIDLQKELDSIDKMIDRLIHKVRNIATELRPDVLDHLGLVAAIEWQVNEFKQRNKIKCTAHFSEKHIEIPEDQKTAVFRIFQEALTNITRHSKATVVNIDLIKGEKYLILQVKDNGIGISKNQLNNIKSIGIIGMRERSFILGGDIAIDGNSEEGTTIILRVPLKQGNMSIDSA